MRVPRLASPSWASLLVGASLALAGCAEPGSEPEPSGAAGAAGTAGLENCEGRAEVFVPGMTKASEDEAVVVELRSAEPPPPANADARWTLALTDAAGALLVGASVVAVPYMPDHGHGAPTCVGEEIAAGVYELGSLALTMPGLWDVGLRVAPEGGAASDASFAFCIGN